MNAKYNRLDVGKINSKKAAFISTKESLEDICPIGWSKDVWEHKVTVTNYK
jgi:hypothetical protein